MKAEDTAAVKIIPSDNDYNVENAAWNMLDSHIAKVEGGETSADGIITGISNGSNVLSVTVTFAHPDPTVSKSEYVIVTKTIKVTVTDEEPPKYTYEYIAAGAEADQRGEIVEFKTLALPKEDIEIEQGSFTIGNDGAAKATVINNSKATVTVSLISAVHDENTGKLTDVRIDSRRSCGV